MPIVVQAEITGVVSKIEVADGALVTVGDVLIIMESMKMEIPVEAPAAGVCRVAVEAEQTVKEGDLLATIE